MNLNNIQNELVQVQYDLGKMKFHLENIQKMIKELHEEEEKEEENLFYED